MQVDVSIPAVARIDDFLLGGGHNFWPDRAAGERLVATVPGIKLAAVAHRGFVRRAVHTITGLGVCQFLDLGAGLPTLSAPHSVANEVTPGAVVVYVDNDPLVVAHAELLTEGDRCTAVVQADLADLDFVLGNDATRKLLDFTQPIAVLMCASLQHLPGDRDDDAAALVAAYVDALCPGSYLALSHMTADHDAEVAAVVQERFAATTTPVWPRDEPWLRKCFAGLDLLEPGVTTPAQWRPDRGDPGQHPDLYYVAVGRKPKA
ncbi:SAM-dependent methyltransferase [Lentzea sp. NPDC092896]|uniref:SAM-dependent methyltransferase n=1 Tax=Lentzea sp. NPDC092896 TaxID=3364127 RepID=UPI00380D21EF